MGQPHASGSVDTTHSDDRNRVGVSTRQPCTRRHNRAGMARRMSPSSAKREIERKKPPSVLPTQDALVACDLSSTLLTDCFRDIFLLSLPC